MRKEQLQDKMISKFTIISLVFLLGGCNISFCFPPLLFEKQIMVELQDDQ